MITSFFSKSKPINFIIVFFISALAFLIANIKFVKSPITLEFIIKQTALFIVCFTSILVLNFIVSKNRLTKKNNYEILLFSLFLLAMTQATSDINILFSNFFILLGLRRVLSIRSQIKLNSKLFDAGFWIAIAALFYFWAILYLIVIFISLILYTDNKLNHWIIPFMGVVTVLILTIAFSIITSDNYFGAFKSLPEVSYSFEAYNSIAFITVITMFLSFGLWSSLFYIKRIRQKKKAFRPSFTIILFVLFIAFAIVVIAPKKDGSEFLFMFAPLAIIITNYIETIEEKWFKEVFLLLLVIVPFVVLML